MRWLDRLTTRAASGETRALPGAGAGMGNTLRDPTSGSGPVKAATQPVSYTSPSTPLLPTWDGRAAIENGYYQSVWVQRTLGAIAETISALPFVAGMDPDNPAVTNPNAPLARLLGPATPQAPGGPHNGTSSQAFLQWEIIQKLATGKMAFEYQVDPKAKGPTGQPAIVGLWPLVSFLLNPLPTAGGSQWFSGFRYQLPTGEINLDASRVFYAWKKSQRDWRQPESYLQAAALPISISIAIERYSWALLQNGLVATHVITSAPLEEPEMRRSWEEQFISNFTGFDQAGKPIFAYADIEGGKVTDAFNIQSIAQTSEQAQLLALAAWVKDEILVATGVPESLIGNASQRIYANADSEYRAFWTSRVLNLVAELQDDINTQLAPLLGPEVGWFDLSRVVALQPPTPFMQPQLTDLISAGIMSVAEAQQQLGVSDSGFIDTSDAPIGEESSSTGAGAPGKASAPMPETRGWSWEYRGMNLNTYRSGTWRRLVHQRERIVVRPTPAPMSHSYELSDTRGYDKAEAILDRVAEMREKRTPNTAEASSTHVPVGPGELWHDPTIHLPDYIEHVSRAFIAKGMPESEAIAQAVGVVRDWAEGKAAHGHVHPDVQAAAAKAIAEWDALKASHNKSKRAVAEFGPGGPGSTFSGNNHDSSGAGLMLPIAEGLKPKPREAELVGPHRYTPNVRDAKHCAKCGKGPLAQVHKDWAGVKRSEIGIEERVGPKGYEHGWIFVGIPNEGDHVRHPHVGEGHVSRVREMGNGRKAVTVHWNSGHVSTHDAVPGHGKARFVPPEEAPKAADVPKVENVPKAPEEPKAQEPKVEPPAPQAPKPAEPIGGSWRRISSDEAAHREVEDLEAAGVTHDKAVSHVAYKQRVLGDQTDTRIHTNGTKVEFSNKARFPEPKKQEVLDAVDALKAQYPDKPMSVAVVSSQANLMRGAYGYTQVGSHHITLTPAAGKPKGQQEFDAGVRAVELRSGHFMADGQDHSITRYTVAHEWGHTLDSKTRSPATQAALNEHLGSTSKYGKTNDKEAFAEAFAAWHVSNGTTTNPLAQALARSEGWKISANPLVEKVKTAKVLSPEDAAKKSETLARKNLATLRKNAEIARAAAAASTSPSTRFNWLKRAAKYDADAQLLEEHLAGKVAA